MKYLELAKGDIVQICTSKFVKEFAMTKYNIVSSNKQIDNKIALFVGSYHDAFYHGMKYTFLINGKCISVGEVEYDIQAITI